jgi:hypothetical protein
MKDFFDQIKSFTDILNVGRLIFYPFAGALVVVPLYLIFRLALVDPAPTLTAQLLIDARHVTITSWSVTWFLIGSSMITGFLIATVGFSVLSDLAARLPREVLAPLSSENTSFRYNYPLLRQNKSEDYATWLISEYYRYVEIATYIPLGGIIGLALVDVYVLLFLVKDFASPRSGFTEAHATFLLVFVVWIVVAVWFWPEIWLKRVVTPAVQSYRESKREIIAGVKLLPREVNPSQPVPPVGKGASS